MKKIKYISYYSDNSPNLPRSCFIAAINKIDYIISAINKRNIGVDVISYSPLESKSFLHSLGGVIDLGKHNTLRYFPSLSSKNRLINKIGYFYKKLFFIIWFLFHVSKNDEIIVYHSLSYMPIITWFKRFKKFRLILEVEEVYADVIGNSKLREQEYSYFQLADAYLFPAELLNEKINTQHKPFSIVYGTYSVEKKREQSVFQDDKIHLIYAGTLDPRKGGAQVALSVGECLSERFHLHILGFGSTTQIEKFKKQVQTLQSESRAKVTYDGLLKGEDYIDFLQSCQVGLSTQKPEGTFNDTSFPSKVLSYLANGLRVVSAKIKVLERSKINDLIYYYKDSSPQSIAEVIENIDFSVNYDSRANIKKLDSQFVDDLSSLFNMK